MRLLPSEQEEKIEEAIARFNEENALNIYEPCDCGSHVRHNNGGNYHQEIYLRVDSGRYFVKYETTCELVARAEWEEIESLDKVHSIIKSHADWL